ncbi:MAG: GNAT family N-acetyltransferase [Clostridia bacterium]|nr:GNAT family N-acetyltransferase [Clostridia bacterium]
MTDRSAFAEKITIRRADREDLDALADLAALLWENSTRESLRAEFADTMQDPGACFFILLYGKEAIGFAQAQLRVDYVEGTHTSPVGYLEGIFVKAEYRRRGYAGMLVRVCEEWAQDNGCSEFASDCPVENQVSYAFHLHMGFVEANRIICFTKTL